MNRAIRLFAVAVAPAILLGAGGCIPKNCPDMQMSLSELVTVYNANAAPVSRLWARAQMDMLATDKRGLPWKVAASGVLLLAKGKTPSDTPGFVLIGREMGRDVFRTGHSPTEDVYYSWYSVGRHGEAYWGRRKYAGAPGIRQLSVDPYQLLALLGLWELPTSRTTLPAVALSMETKPCQYVVTCIDRQPLSDRVLFRREMLFQWAKDDPLPRCHRINFFDSSGRRVMTAQLARYKPIEIVDGRSALSEMPTDITLEAIPWPGITPSIRRIHLTLTGMTTQDKWDPEAMIFDGEDLPADLVKIQLDRHLVEKDKDTRP